MAQKNEFYESIVRGLDEAIEGKNVKTSKRSIAVMPIKHYSPKRIIEIRKKSNLSQKMFAEYMGVSIKTVEAWERGKNTPSGSSSRILSMFEMDDDLTKRFPFVKEG